MRSSLAALATVVAALVLAGAGPAGFRAAAPDHRWSFPADLRAHPGYRNEWWYFTGTLEVEGEPGRRLGYQLTFFRVGLAPEAPPVDSAWATADAVMVHAAVTDVSTGTHAFSEVLWRAVPLLGGFPAAPDPVLAWAPGAGRDGRSMGAAARRRRLPALRARRRPRPRPRPRPRAGEAARAAGPERPVAQVGGGGVREPLRLADPPRDARDGRGGGRRLAVRGESWMDREIGSSQLAPDQVGWDWWSLRLRDGRDLTLYVLRRKDGSASWRNATLVDRDGQRAAPRARRVDGARDRVVAEWGERRDVPVRLGDRGAGEGIRLSVAPEVRDAENRSTLVPGLFYWEGPVRAVDGRGAPAGEGYVELTGYGDKARPPI